MRHFLRLSSRSLGIEACFIQDQAAKISTPLPRAPSFTGTEDVWNTTTLFSLCCLCLPTCLTWDLSAAFLWVTTIWVWGRCGSTTSPGGNNRLLTSISQHWSVHRHSITRASPAATLAKKLPQDTWGFKAAGEEAGDCATSTWRCRRLGWERADPLGHLAEDAASDSQGGEIPLLLHTALLRKLREGEKKKKKRKIDFKAF